MTQLEQAMNSQSSEWYRWSVLGILMVGTFTIMLNSSIVNIALPHMKPVILVAILIRTIDACREFDKIKILTDGGPGFVTSNLYFQTFLQAFRFFEMGYSMALSWICALFIIIITTILVSRIRR